MLSCIPSGSDEYLFAVRVGVAGATGYAGVELIRRLSRHPSVSLAAAMGSVGSEPRRIPALNQIWDAPVQPLDVDQLAALDAVFLAMPDTLSAEVGPALAARGPRVFDLSGAFRLRDKALRERWYPHSPGPDAAGDLRPDRALPRRARRRDA